MHILTRHADGSQRLLMLDDLTRANAMSEEMVEALHDEIDSATADGVELLALASVASTFSSGFDLSGLDNETDASLLYRFVRIALLLERVRTAPFVTVAMVNGWAVGAGADLVMACDHRLGTDRSRFRFPGSGFGVRLGAERLTELVGASRAFTIASEAAAVEPPRALDFGLLTELIADSQVPLPPVPNVAALKLGSYVHQDGVSFSRAVPSDADLAALTRSVAAQRGVKERLVAYRERWRNAR